MSRIEAVMPSSGGIKDDPTLAECLMSANVLEERIVPKPTEVNEAEVPRTYQYRALATQESIRILVLQPAANNEDPLITTIEHRLRRDPETKRWLVQDYIAISYAWGNPKLTHQISCDGQNLGITSNVDRMLRDLRGPQKRRLWIDAICLNQNDNDEKSSQIPLMSKIYTGARKVHIWLEPTLPGREPPITMHAFYVIRSIIAGNTQLNEAEAYSLEALLSKCWFGRRWTIQETAAHPETTILCDGRSLHWAEVTAACTRIDPSGLSDSLKLKIKVVKVLRFPTDGMFSLLDRFHNFSCTDPRDRLAALQALAARKQRHPRLDGWTVDYSKDVAYNYRKFTEAAILSGYGGYVEQHLSFFGSLREQFSEVPEWVPNWNRAKLTEPVFLAKLARDTMSIALENAWQGRSEWKCPLVHRCHLNEVYDPQIAGSSRLQALNKFKADISNRSRQNVRGVAQISLAADCDRRDVESYLQNFLMGVGRRRSQTGPVAHLLQHALALPSFKAQDYPGLFTYDAVWKWVSACDPYERDRFATYHGIDLLEWAYLNDVVVPAARELLRDHVLFRTLDLLGVGRKSLKNGYQISSKSIGHQWALDGDADLSQSSEKLVVLSEPVFVVRIEGSWEPHR